MKRNILNISILICALFVFSGCLAKYENGVVIPDENTAKIRSKYKVFVDSSATIKAEENFLNKTVELLKKGFKSPYDFFKNSNYYDDKKIIINTSDTKLSSFSLNNNDIKFNSLYINYEDIQLLLNPISFYNRNKFVNFNLEINDRTLVSSKKYKNKYEVLIDFMNISSGLYRSLGKELVKETGFQFYALDGKELMNNKLVLIPLTKIFPLKFKINQVLKGFRYSVTENKKEADIVIQTEVLGLSYKKDLKKSKRTASILNMNRAADTNAPDIAMNLASFSGAGNGASAAIGGVLLLANIFGGDSNPIIYNSIASVYLPSNPGVKNIAILPLNAQIVGNMIDLNEDYNKRELNRPTIGISKIAEGIGFYLDNGHLGPFGHIVKQPEIYEDGLIDYLEEKD